MSVSYLLPTLPIPSLSSFHSPPNWRGVHTVRPVYCNMHYGSTPQPFYICLKIITIVIIINNNNAEDLHLVRHRQIDTSDGHGRHGWRGSQLTGRADDQGLRLVWVELQAVLHVPLSDVSGTSGENGETLGSVVCVHGQSELGVICVLMMIIIIIIIIIIILFV